MRIRLIQQKQTFVFGCKAQQAQHGEQLLLTLAELAEGHAAIVLLEAHTDAHFFDQLRNVSALQIAEEMRWRLLAYRRRNAAMSFTYRYLNCSVSLFQIEVDTRRLIPTGAKAMS